MSTAEIIKDVKQFAKYKRLNHADYEIYKKRISSLALTADKYEQAVKSLADVIGI